MPRAKHYISLGVRAAASRAWIIPICKLCKWFCDRFWPECAERNATFSKRSRDWERANSNDGHLFWFEDTEQHRELIKQAFALYETDPGAAFQIYLKAAEAGSAWAMHTVGYCYDTGRGVEADSSQALHYYHRATSAGSWMAAIDYARLLAKHGRYDDCEKVLEDGVRKDFVPASFWLAWLRYKRSRKRKTCREVRPMLEYAAEHGHPDARLLLSQWMLLGKLGLMEIPRGLRLARQSMDIGSQTAASEPQNLEAATAWQAP